jgi:hypothetical protein
MTLAGDHLSGQYFEEEPKWTYKPGYSTDNVSSSMRKGAVWGLSAKRR